MTRAPGILGNTVVLVVTVGVCWLGVNTWLYHTRAVDLRAPIAVLADEWPKDENTMLFIAPQNYVRGDVHPVFRNVLPPGVTMPLGGVPGIRSIYCQEDEGWYIERTDRYGFFNPDAAWERPIDILLVGDSFANGACTPKNSRFYLAEQANTVTVGSGGNGPLLELAVLREFLLTYSARHVVWYIVSNDDTDLEHELSYLPLRAYLDDLAHHQNYFQLNLSSWRNRVLDAVPGYLAINADNIAHIRAAIRSPLYDIAAGRYFFSLLTPARWIEAKSVASVLPTFNNILGKAHELAEGAGAAITFVFLPSAASCRTGRRPDFFTDLMTWLKQHEIDYIDGQALAAEDRCTQLFARRTGGHFTAYGYRRLADFVFRHIRTRPN